MLLTIIYRSHLSDDVPVKSLETMISTANQRNEQLDITGILIFNGTHFFQLLEGPKAAVEAVYNSICGDSRHHNLVELMRDYGPSRRFGNAGMELFDLREHDREIVMKSVLDKSTTKYRMTYNDRALQFLQTFVEATEKTNYFEIPDAAQWRFIPDDIRTLSLPGQTAIPGIGGCEFAFQPIIDPMSRQIVSLEALVRGPGGCSPTDYFAQFAPEERYQADIRCKKTAFTLAQTLGLKDQSLSINLRPMSLVSVPDAASFLLAEIEASGLVPEQIVVEVTEHEAISHADAFTRAIEQLKAAGISLAIDDFGAGFAGLSLLTRFQPDKLKIDRNIIGNVHESGPKQAIVQGIIKCCSSLEITLIADGVEKPEEWMWLEAAGIYHSQGGLFAQPKLNGIPAIAWPEMQ